MFVDHILESRTDTCETENKCVDYIKLTFPSVSDTELTCGKEAELDELHVDGYSGLHAEFYANRYEQDKGFLLHVMCYEPGAVPSRKKKRQADECVLVSGTVREPETVDSAKQLVSSVSLGAYRDCCWVVEVVITALLNLPCL